MTYQIIILYGLIKKKWATQSNEMKSLATRSQQMQFIERGIVKRGSSDGRPYSRGSSIQASIAVSPVKKPPIEFPHITAGLVYSPWQCCWQHINLWYCLDFFITFYLKFSYLLDTKVYWIPLSNNNEIYYYEESKKPHISDGWTAIINYFGNTRSLSILLIGRSSSLS